MVVCHVCQFWARDAGDAAAEHHVNCPVRPVLAEIAAQYPRTDKGAGGYLAHYERHLGPVRRDVRRVLEVGVREGDSLRMWRDFFPGAEVVGLDIDPACVFAEDRITVLRGDVCDADTLAAARSLGPFDVVIDDGGHKASQIVAALAGLHPALAPGGFYCVEDLGTQVMGEYRDYVDRHPSGLGELLGLVSAMNDPGGLPASQWFAEVHFYRWLAIMRR